jgi:predicted nucleic acid-binding protein
MRLYLDNCCFNRPFDDQSQIKIRLETEAKLNIQHSIQVNENTLVWSYILEYENMQNPYIDRRTSTMEWKKLAEIYCLENEIIISYAETLLAKGIKVKDALHIACAVAAKSDYFITTDKKLLNTPVDEIEIISPIMFIDKL